MAYPISSSTHDDYTRFDDAPDTTPSSALASATTEPVWNAVSHLLLLVMAYVVLLVWVSFGAAECPKK